LNSLCPNVISTTGRGSTGVGLTAAVVVDKDTNERQLEAGAMVLGDRGIVCIDEFDKMNENDRVAIHEVMEQQTVTIAKAGIHVSLNARCSVLAAANPLYGEYQKHLSCSVNIGLPDTLLSRFDLVFIIKDETNSDRDRKIAKQVLQNHTISQDQLSDALNLCAGHDYIIEQDINIEDQTEKKVLIKINSESNREILSRTFLRKYIYYAKINCPALSDEASNFISSAWVKLREQEINERNQKVSNSPVPISVRTLETIIRLSTAHAKLRLAKVISKYDCEVAFDILNYSLNNESYINEDDDSYYDEEKMNDEEENETKKLSLRSSNKKSSEGKPVIEINENDDRKRRTHDEIDEVEKIFSYNTNIIGGITEDQKKFIFKIIFESTNKKEFQQITFDDLWHLVVKHKDKELFLKSSHKSELLDIVLALDSEGKVLYSSGTKDITLV
jgi:DNA replication licensing factor MCM3